MFGLSKNEQLAKYMRFKFPGYKFTVKGDVAGKVDGGFDIYWEGPQDIRAEVEKVAAEWIGEEVKWTVLV